MARLISLDYDPVYGDEDVVRSSFSGNRSVFDFDVAIWDPRSSFRNYQLGSTSYQGLRALSDDQSVRFTSDVARRRQEFVEFVNAGRTLFVIARAPLKCYVATGEVTHSGTGRNRQSTRIVTGADLLDALPIPKSTTFMKASGDRIEFLGDGPLSALLRTNKEYLSYDAVIAKCPGKVVAAIAGTDRGLSFQQVAKNGGLLAVIPPPDFSDFDYDDENDDDDASGYLDDVAAAFQEGLIECANRITGLREDERPAWAGEYSTGAQQKARAAIIMHEEIVAKARASLSAAQAELVSQQAHDQLYLGTGRALELEVKEVLELLGGEVADGEPGRSDWLVTFPEGDAVVEVKGVSKSAAEKQAAQLEKWVASGMAEDGSTPKGILVVNSWRELPLAKRIDDDFPPQMIPYCKARGHCLVTGLQLFVIRSEVETQPERAEKWRRKLLDTSGRMTGVKNWTTVITLETPAVEEQS